MVINVFVFHLFRLFNIGSVPGSPFMDYYFPNGMMGLLKNFLENNKWTKRHIRETVILDILDKLLQ